MTNEKKGNYIVFPESYSMDKWREKIINLTSNVNYYVYEHYLDGKLFYIGKGTKDRCLVLKGRSEDWDNHVDGRENEIFVDIIKTFELEEDALDFEVEHIVSMPSSVELVNKINYKKRNIDKYVKVKKNKGKTTEVNVYRGGLRRDSLAGQSNTHVFYNTKLNKITLSGLTKIQSDIFMSILSNKKDDKDDKGRLIVNMSFKDIRKAIDNKSITSATIKITLKELNSIEVPCLESNMLYKLLLSFSMKSKNSFEAVLSDKVSEGANYKDEEYVALNLSEYANFKSNPSKEMYRILRQFRHSGSLIISKEVLIKLLNPPKSYNEYDFIRKILFNSIKDNNRYFRNLEISNLTGNSLPDICRFRFSKQKKESIVDMMSDKEIEEEELRLIIKNGGGF